MIVGIAQLQQIMWAVTTAASILLLVLLAVRKNYRTYPGFAFYIFVNLALGISLFIIYRRWGFSSRVSWSYAWGMQAVAIGARALAVVEICRHLLSCYAGVWALAKRILLMCAGLVLLYSGLAARHQWQLALPSASRGLELSIATVIVVLFLFVRYYDVRTARVDRLLAIGFCLYSCFRALNDSIANRYLYSYAELWSLLGMFAFLASLLLWTWALRKPQTEVVSKESLFPVGLYESVAPQINLRLRSLNERLSQFWKPEATRN